MKISKFILFLLIFNLFIFNGCSGNDNVSIPKPLYCPVHSVQPSADKNDNSCFTVLADEHLEESHKTAILQALNEWADKTANTLTYSLSFVDMSTEPADNSVAHTIKIYVRDPGPGYLGWTSWDEDNHSAYTFVEPSIDGELFRRIMLHELGHAFALDFSGDDHYEGPFASVMHPSIGDDSLHLCCPELSAFCTKYGCRVDCTNVEKSTVQSTSVFWKETKLSP